MLDERWGVRSMSLDELSYLWETPTGRHVLISVDESAGDSGLVIYDHLGPSLELIHDDDLHVEVVRRMREEGVPVMDDFPKYPNGRNPKSFPRVLPGEDSGLFDRSGSGSG
ncbi:hypothetical protein [Streptomyces sp. NPDC090022]|uniref:hypothetical protein n=1 Tax=Streptomyces sp. NPDC090022 TaxID=3365920 RepID=UPI0038306C05